MSFNHGRNIFQASLSHRLAVSLDQYDLVVIGTTTNTVNQVFESKRCLLRLGNAAVRPLHCEICKSHSSSITLEVKCDAIVCINGLRVTNPRHRLEAGDAVLLGLSSLFALCHEEISNSHVR